MPVENDTSHQNGQQDAGGGGGNGNVPTETSSQPQQAPEPNATIVNGTHAKVSDAPEDQLAKDAPKDAKKSDGSASFLRAARAGNLEKVLEFLKTNTDINTCNANGLNALHLASKEGHVNVVRELLQRGANVDAATKKGNTALHIASLAGQEEIVKVLVQHQALVNIQSQNGFTPLYMAAQENHDSVVRFLLANNANQSLATEDGFTPLAVALQQGHDKVVAVLLENDTRGKVRLPALHIAAKKDDTKAAALLLHTDHNPDVTSKSGFTPLHIASHYGNENIANLLIQRGADVNYIAKHQITPLHVASKWGKGNMVSLLIDKGANYEAKTRDGLTPLHCAARSGHEAVVDMLLEKGAPITSKTKNGLAPLHMASQGDHVDAARILLYHKAPVDDVTVDFLTALHVAAHCGHVRVAKLLLDRKAEANARALNGFTPLHIACKKNRIKVVELLLKHGASIEATTESGLTPLHVASFMGCMNIVIYLLQHSATADVPTVRGETPLHLAARANQTDIIRILLRNGAQVDARAREQQTALHIASRLGNSDIVVLLLQHGAAVDATTKDHYTALHIAAKEGQEEVASVLLEHGASLTSTTKKGFTPLHLAAKYGNMKVARLLLQKDALVDAQGKNGVTPLHVAAHYDHQNVALLLLDKGASPHATAKNGYTPLHIAARKNQMDIATTLLEYGASANAESKAGFTPLHLSSQEGHTDMATLLIEHNAAPGACAKNGLTPLHLCGQEDRVNVAAILVKHGAQIDPVTKAGYTPLHVACHFGQMNMVRFLLQHGAKVNSTTQLGYTPLHQAAQQGHTQIVNLLLENKAEPNTETNDGKTALSIAQRLGYISVVETLKIVTETTINTTTTTTTEEKYKVVVPETMHETFMSESEDEGGDDTMLGDQSYRYLTVDEMKSLGDDSLPIDVTKDEKMDMSFSSNQMAAPPVAPADHLSPQHQKEHYAQMTASYPADNVDVGKTPILAGPESLNTTLNTTIDSAMIEAQIEPQIIQTKLAPQQMVENNTDLANNGSVSEKAAEILNGWEGFLVSFMVDARGGAMRGCRHSGVRVIIPPRKAAMPMRVTCRYLKKDKLVHAPPLMEGEALASRILEMGPAGAKFLGPVIIEVPHFASLRGKEREIVILRSDNGETWREHTLEATEEAVQEVLNESFDGEELKQLEDLNTNRITRILTTDFPQYFAIVTRIRQEVHAIGPEGGMVSSTVVPQVQAVFPQGALTKKIKVGLQAQPIPTDLVAKLLGNRVAVSPIVTVEPRRRKFHKPITLTIPVPQASSKGMINQYSGEAPTLRLLCSITGGTTRAQWEDVTGSTPLTFVNDCVSFTTTVSARFWLMDCSNIPEATKMATELYREAIHVPFMAKFVVFSKRHQLEEARMRVFCMTDDREDKTLEHQELFVEVAKSRDVEVLEGKPQFLEFAGNLVPVTKSGDQLAFNFYAFRENRLPFTVRVKDQHADPIGRVAFMRQPKVGRGDPPQTPICNLNIALPDNIQPEPAPSEPDLLALEKKYSFLSISKADTIHRANLRLTDISNMLGTDWVALAHELEVTDSDINIIKSQYPDNAPQQAIVMLRLWMQTAGNKASGNTVGKALRKINREDIVKQCIFNVEVVTDDIERAMAKAHFDQSGFDTFKDELGPSRDATLNRDVSLDVSYDEQDMMKEAESAEEEEENQRAYHDKSSREQHTADLSPTYESEEKKYAGEEKVVTDEKVTKEEAADDSTTFTSFTATSTPIKRDTKEEEKLETDKKDKASKPAQIVPDTLQESKEETTVTDKDAKKPVEELVTKESISKEEPKSLEKEKPVTVVKEKIKEKEDDTTPMVKEKVKPEEKKEKDEKPEASQKEPEKTVTSTTKTEVVGGPKDITTVTTETKSYTTAEDGSVQEHIVVKKQTSKVVDGKEMEEDKSAILQKLGEELGKLDEQLEEKFKKRKAEKPEVVQEEVKEEAVVAQRREGQTQPTSQVVVEHGSEPPTLPATTTTTTTSITPIPDGFTQASVESSQMSSTRGTADVSFPGADTAVKQLDGALTQQTVPWIEDGRISHEDLPLQSSYHKKGHSQAISAILPADQAHSNRTEERGCSPITVLEARHNAEEMSGKLHARGSSHTITTTTSWGAPLSATTNIQIEDENSPHCLQFTLHSESRVTLHASKDVIQDLQLVKQQQEQKQPQELYQTSSEKKYHEGTSDSCVPEEIFDRNEDQETHEKLDKLLDISTAEKPLLKSEEIETSDLKHSEYRQKDSINEKIVSQTEKEIISSNVTRVEDAPEVYSTSVVFSSEDKIVPRETSAEEAKRVTPETINSEALAALGDDHDQAASEVTASSAHRPTTLMITSNSNESSDDAECTTNDPTRLGGENDIPQDPEQGGGMAGEEESKQEESDRKQSTAVGERLSGSESGAVPRLERSMRSSPRTTTLVKVKVEKRPVGSHSQVRDRNSHDHMTVVRTHSVEEEVRGLMQEVKEATSQIKQEVKELRQADTPTPDTPTPLREFKEFLNREEEQEQERLPTIKEICRESEEDSSAGMGGEHMRDEYYSHLRPNTPVHEPSLPEQLAPTGFDDKSIPDSGYSTMEGYYAKSVDPAQTAKYSPSCCEVVPEGSFDEHSVKSELESPSSPVDIKALSSVVSSVDSAVPTASEKQSKSKFKSFLKKVCKLTSKGGSKYEARNNDSQGELTLNRDSSEQNLRIKDYTLEDRKTSGMVKEKEEIQSQQVITDDSKEADPVKFVLNRYTAEKKPKSDEGNMILRPTEQSAPVSDENCGKMGENIDSSASCSPITPDRSEYHAADPPVPVMHYISTTSVKEIHCTNIQMPDSHESETAFLALSLPENEGQVYGHMKEAEDVSPKVFDIEVTETPQEDVGFTGYEDLENLPPPISNHDIQSSIPETIAKQPMEVKDQCQEDSELLPLQTLDNPIDWTLTDSPTEQQLASFSPIECVDDVRESDLQNMDCINEYESLGVGVTVPDRVIDSVPVYDNTFTIPEEIEEETTSFNQQIIMISEPPPLIRKGSHIPKLSEINKFTLSEEEYDDFIDLPDTDIVEIMETVIEVDETEESDEMHQEEEAAHEEYIAFQEEKYRKLDDETNMAVEIWKAKRKKDKTILCVQEEEIQLLPEADIETFNEAVTSSDIFTSCDSPLQMENKITSDITLLPQDHEQEYEIKLHDSSVTGEACLLEPEEVCHREIDEAKRIEECTEETIKRAREITDHILKQIENMDVGNKKITDIETEGDTDFDFISECGYKSPASKETDSEMETSFSDDFPVTVPELDETDSWLQTIKAYQSLTSKASAACEDTPNVPKSKKGKEARKNISDSDSHWLMFMKKARNISHIVTKENEADHVSESGKADESDIQDATEVAEKDVIRRDAMECVICESEYESSSADCDEKDTDQHLGMADDITESPYKVCLYTSDGESLHLKGILDEYEKLSPIHNEGTSEMVDDKKEPSIYESSLCLSSDNLMKKSECIDQKESMLGDDKEEPLSSSGDMKSAVISVKQASDFVCEVIISEDHLLATSEVCQEVGKVSITFHENDLCSNEVGHLTQSIVDVKDPSIEHLQESEAAVDSRTEELANKDDEKNTMMSSISEELKAMISSLECTLVAGEGRYLEIGPLMKRLDEMEREMVTVDFEASESSIPTSVYDLNVHCIVSTSQTSTSTEEVKMPVGLEKDSATLSVPGGPSPTGEMNGQDIQEALTDIEELHSEGDISPMPKRKTLLVAPKQDTGALTDTEDMDLSGEEDDILPEEKKNLPTIQALGLLPEPTKEVVNLTEGYAREPSPLLGSDSETEKEDVLGRHQKNVKKVDTLNELSVPTDDVVEGLTDVEDMVASGDEEVPAEIDDSLPDYYMAQGENVSNKENFRVVLPAPKIFVTKKDDSSDEEEDSRKQKSKSRGLRVDVAQEGTTDVEDLDVSDKDVSREPLPQAQPVVKDKVKRKKQVRRKVPSQKPPSKTLTAPSDDASSVTDVEILTGDENVEEEEEDESNLNISKDELDEPTDSEDVEASDAEEIEDLIPKPVEKIEKPCIPEPHRERIKISDVEERAEEESGAETDEEGFELNDREDERPLMPRKKVIHEPLDNEEKDTLDVKETDETAFTDTEDFDIEEKEEEEVIDEILNRVPEESEIYTIKEMEASMGRITKKEMIRDADAEIKRKIKEAEQAGITIQAALEEECLTDVEDLDATEESKKSKNKVTAVKGKKKEDETDEESVNESDIEEEISKPQKNKRRSKRLPVAPQLSEVRFVETETGPLSIVITPDSKLDTEAVEKVSGITFIESENDEGTTDVEEISDGEGSSALNAATNKPEPVTDTEDLDFDPAEVSRPRSPLPPHLKYNVLESPKRELVYIKEDKYGVPQVTVRKLQKDELFVSDIEDIGATDTEDIEVSEEEALRLAGVTTDSTSDFELIDSGNIEVASKVMHKKTVGKVDEEEGNTDVEELILSKKPRHRTKARSKLVPAAQGEDNHTDTEFLSDVEDKGKLAVRTSSPNAHTDVEDFDHSDIDIEEPERDDAPTPDIIRDAAIKKTIHLKEGPDGTTYTENATVASSKLLDVEAEPEGTTDVEDMEMSGAEDEGQVEHPPVDLPEYEASSVDISERSSVPSTKNEEKQVKDNLLLPEDNFNNITDVESLGEGEGTHEASQPTEHQTSLPQEQAASSQPTSGTKAGSDGGLHGGCPEAQDVVQPNSGAGAQEAPGLDVEEMSSGMEGYASDGNDPMTTTHITRYDPDPLPITTSTTTTTTTTTTRIIRRTKEEDGEVKEEEEIFEEY